MQPSQFPLPFDAQGNLILTGIHAPDGTWSIDAGGNAVFTTLTVNNSLIYQGTELSELLAECALGIITLAKIVGDGTTTYDGTNPMLIGRIVIKNFDATRQYKIGYRCRIDAVASDPVFIDIKGYIKYDADATNADTQLFEHQIQRDTTSATDSGVFIEHPFNDTNPGGTDAHISIYANAEVAGFKIDTTTAGVNARFWIEDIGPAITYDTWNQTGGGGSPPTSHTKTYSATSSASFASDGTNRAGFDSGHAFQGYFSSTNGNQFSMIGFDFATIQADLSGATITKTELYLNNLHWYNNSGGTAVVGTHNQSSVSGNHSSGQVTAGINTFSGWSVGEAKWVTLNNSIGNALKNNTAKGIALGQGPSTSHTYYGYFAGNGQTGEPQLRITYTK